MGNKIFLTGLFLALILPILGVGLFGLPVEKLGAVVALVGIILIWLDK